MLLVASELSRKDSLFFFGRFVKVWLFPKPNLGLDYFTTKLLLETVLTAQVSLITSVVA